MNLKNRAINIQIIRTKKDPKIYMTLTHLISGLSVSSKGISESKLRKKLLKELQRKIISYVKDYIANHPIKK